MDEKAQHIWLYGKPPCGERLAKDGEAVFEKALELHQGWQAAVC